MATAYLTDAGATGSLSSAGTPAGSDTGVPEAGPTVSEIGGSGAEPSPPDFIVDTVAPPAPDRLAFSPGSGAVVDGVTRDTELVLTGEAEPGSTVTVRGGETVLGTAPAGASGEWSFPMGRLADGVHPFTATSTDAAGNTGAPSTALAVTVDTQAPSVTLTTVQNDLTDEVVPPAGLTNDNTPTLTGTAEAGSTVQVIVSRAGSPEIVLTAALSGTDWSVAPGTALADGPYTITVKAMDASGNVAEVSDRSD